MLKTLLYLLISLALIAITFVTSYFRVFPQRNLTSGMIITLVFFSSLGGLIFGYLERRTNKRLIWAVAIAGNFLLAVTYIVMMVYFTAFRGSR